MKAMLPRHPPWETFPPSVQAIRERLLRVVPFVAGPLKPDAPIAACGGDSIDFVELLCAIEADYGVRLTLDDLASLRNVGELLTLVDRQATRRPPPSAPAHATSTLSP